MTPPFVKGIGRLATSRYDFQDHVDGTNFQHNANIIEISPAIVISGTPYSNVAAALSALNSTISASTLAGDADGYLLTNKVLKINGATVPAAGTLQTGNVLQVTGLSSLGYAPINLSGGSNYIIGSLPTGNQSPQAMAGDVVGTTAANTLTLSGDIVGRAGATLVKSIDGYPSGSGTVNVNASLDIKKTTIFDGYVISSGIPVTQFTTLPVATNVRTWLQTIPDPAVNAITNIYKNNSTGGYEIASNCRWTGTAWSCYTTTDSGGSDAGLTSIGSSGTNLIVQTKSTTGLTPFVSTWTDTFDPGVGWDYYMQSSYSNILMFNTIAAGSEFSNTLYSNNIPKAWASFTLGNAPTGGDAHYILIPGTDGNFFNCTIGFSSASDDSTDNLHVTFVNAMQDTAYTVNVVYSDVPLNNGGPPSSTSMLFPQVMNKSPTSFDIIAVGFDGTQYPFNTAYNKGFSYVDIIVMGIE